MALRPAGRTLSSLTGILVVAAALWLLLNFVYAPSCGRFSCSYTPAWWPQASADTGDGCPDSLQEATNNEQWLRERIKAIQDEHVTTGVFYDPDGKPRQFVSGRDDDMTTAVEVGHQVGAFSARGSPITADHVEVKVAAAMRKAGIQEGLLIINNPGGPCGIIDPEGPFSCHELVPRLLASGTTLRVMWVDQKEVLRSQLYTGGA